MPSRQVAVITHGTGSDSRFVRKAFLAHDLGVDEVLAVDDRSGDLETVAAEIDSEITRAVAVGDVVRLIGGISLGAHATVRWAARQRDISAKSLLLVFPAWIGAPGDVAEATAHTASLIESSGSASLIARLRRDAPGDWVVAALAQSWRDYGDDALAAALRRTAASPGPELAEFASVSAPCGVVALADDPLHPSSIAARWSQLIPHAGLDVLPRNLGGLGVAEIGRAAMRALSESR